jgi:hypothetical protein
MIQEWNIRNDVPLLDCRPTFSLGPCGRCADHLIGDGTPPGDDMPPGHGDVAAATEVAGGEAFQSQPLPDVREDSGHLWVARKGGG